MLIEEFIARWKDTEASERANKDSFLKELCRALGVREPDGKTGDFQRDVYVFEADSVLYDENGRRHVGSMDLYKKGCFVLEAKQGSTRKGKKIGTARRDAPGWGTAMNEAHGQALGYAKTLETPPPFVIVADIGYCFDLYACFDGSGAYRPYPNGQKHRLYFKNLAEHANLLRSIWLDPFSLDPSKRSQAVTIDVSEKLAELAKGLEREHPPEKVAKFLMRCVFCMFAEDISLLRDKVFTQALEKQWLPEPESFKDGVEALWDAMNKGKRFFILGKLLRFNGGLFAEPEALPLSAEQIAVLLSAARKEWSEVQPAIFGTLIERALDEKERHNLGAHFTPASYVERLLRPTIEEPLREEWDGVRALVRRLVPPNDEARRSDVKKAQDLVLNFHKKLCETTVLDPACGSGNFLYLALDLLKRLESEVLAMLHDLGVRQLDLAEQTVTPRQFKGIEIRRQSKEIAELVLWIGYLQWHHRMYGQTKNPPEPILRDYKNIECRDAVLAHDGVTSLRDEAGTPRTRWDGTTTTKHPVTGKEVPDGNASIQIREYENPRRATWPKAHFIVGNPPYLGARRIRLSLGDGYVDALRRAVPEVGETADLVMYWWDTAARQLSQTHDLKRFGFITTNSIVQNYSRPVLERHLGQDSAIELTFAIPDHPWIESHGGAAVRVAMTVAQRRSSAAAFTLGKVTSERECDVTVEEHRVERISASLTSGNNLRNLASLRANRSLCFQGVVPAGAGFKIDSNQFVHLGLDPATLPSVVRPYVIGRDIVQRREDKHIIDFFGLSEDEARQRWPHLFQVLLDSVLPERQHNKRDAYRQKWWLFAEPRPAMRSALEGLARFIVTPYTSKFRPFVFVEGSTVPDAMAYVVASDDAYVLAVLSSRIHTAWAMNSGGRLGVGNDSRYTSDTTFLPFPFPVVDDVTKAQLRHLGEALDGHRKRQQAKHPELTLTGMYNVLEKLRLGTPLSSSEKRVHEEGLVSVLGKLHQDIDVAVLNAYGWPHELADEQILEHLVALNHERAAEETVGHVRWLRPAYQKALKAEPKKATKTRHVDSPQLSFVWPDTLPEQVATVRNVVSASAAALSASEVSAACSGASVEKVTPVLETLEALGHFVSFKDGEKRWASLARVANDRTPGPGVRKASSAPPTAEEKLA